MAARTTSHAATSPRRILRRPEVEHRTGLSRSTLYDHIRAGTFPASIRLGKNSVGWLESDVDAWLDLRIAASTSTAKAPTRATA